MAGHLQQLLSEAAANPDQKLWELQLLSAREREQLRGVERNRGGLSQ